MGLEKKVTVTIDAEIAAALEASVAAGEHPSIEDAVTAALDDWWADRAVESMDQNRLCALLDEAANDGTIEGEEVFARLRAKYEARKSTP